MLPISTAGRSTVTACPTNRPRPAPPIPDTTTPECRPSSPCATRSRRVTRAHRAPPNSMRNHPRAGRPRNSTTNAGAPRPSGWPRSASRCDQTTTPERCTSPSFRDHQISCPTGLLGSFDGGHRSEDGGHMFGIVSGDGISVASTDGEVSTGAQDLALRPQAIADGGSEQVDLQFHRQYGHPPRHERERRVAARAVENGDADPSVEEPVLLRQTRDEGHFDLDRTRLNASEFSAEGGHETLPREAFPHSLPVVRVTGFERGAHSPESIAQRGQAVALRRRPDRRAGARVAAALRPTTSA